MLYWESARALWKEVDGDLISGVRVLEGSMRGPPPPPFRNQREREPGRDFSGRPFPSPHPFPPPNDREPRFPPPDHPPPRMVDWGSFGRMAPIRLVRGDRPMYRAIWNRDSTLTHHAVSNTSLPRWEDVVDALRGRQDGDVTIRQRGSIREAFLLGTRRDFFIGVGIDVQPERDRLTRLCWLVGTSGLLVCGLGLAGGAWCLRRTLRPMQAMQSTASTIRSDNLSQRFNVESIDSELGDLAASINSMLDRVEAGFEQQRQFAADASHELRTPLAILLSSTELALRRERTPEAYRAELEKCQRAAQRMKSLIEALLALSRLDASSQSLEMEEVCLEQVCRDQMELHQQVASEHRVTLESHLEPCILRGHQGVLERMVANLLLNGIVYNREGGSVVVTLKTEGESIVLEVADTGIGIPPAEVEHLFKRFYRVDKARSRQRGGSGLGLAICETVVQLHHGKIAVESKVGEGSTFRITLPKQQPAVVVLRSQTRNE